MNPSSNDIPDVAALLQELESSAAWQEIRAAHAQVAPPSAAPVAGPSLSHGAPAGPSHTNPTLSTNDIEPSAPPAAGPSTALPNISGTSVADLLSQLSSSTRLDDSTPSTSTGFSYDYNMAAVPLAPVISHSTAPAPVIHHENRRNLTFVQSLPILSELGEDPGFVSAIKKMKDDQNRLERRLWEDREAIYAKYQDKIKVAQTKAQMIGTPVSQHEINMILDAFNKEIFRFDRERILPAWDGLVSRQQNELDQMTVPTMFVTTDVQDRKKQQQVISVLETITGPNIA